MLRRHAGRFGRSEKYSIYDETDLRKVLVELVKAHRGADGAAEAEEETLAADVARMAVKADRDGEMQARHARRDARAR